MRKKRLTLSIRCYSQVLLQSLQNLISHLCRGDLSTEILRPELEATELFLIKYTSDCSLDGLGRLIQPHRVPQQQGGAEDSSNGVGDTLSSDVGG